MLTAAIRSKVDALWDRFWSGGIANPLTAIEQISYLLFMRRLDALDRKKAEDADYLGKKHVSFFKAREDCRWSRFKNLPGEEMLSHVRDQVFPFIKGLGGEDQPFSRSMQDAAFMIPKPSLLVEAVGLIDELYAEVERERPTGARPSTTPKATSTSTSSARSAPRARTASSGRRATSSR